MHLLVTSLERDLLRFGDADQQGHIACGPGCGACCVLNVSVLFPEAISIAWYVRRHLSAKAIEELKDRLYRLLVKTRWLDDEERLFLREPCAFLDRNGYCMIHVVRPLLCRSITSTNAEKCHDAIALAALDEAPAVEMNLFYKNLADVVYRAMAEALQELGLDHRPRRLTSAVLGLLSEPELLTYYLSGEPIPLH